MHVDFCERLYGSKLGIKSIIAEIKGWFKSQTLARIVAGKPVSPLFDDSAALILLSFMNDLDQNGLADDIDADATSANFENAILGPFASQATDLLVYMADHGGEETFRLSEKEVLSAA